MSKMSRKSYCAPKLTTRQIQLGVFGDYADNRAGGRGVPAPAPVEVIKELNLHME
jgi:hypothetical protein